MNKIFLRGEKKETIRIMYSVLFFEKIIQKNANWKNKLSER